MQRANRISLDRALEYAICSAMHKFEIGILPDTLPPFLQPRDWNKAKLIKQKIYDFA